MLLSGDHLQTGLRVGVSDPSGLDLQQEISSRKAGSRKAARAIDVSSLVKRLVQLESEQKADEGRIDAALRKAESDLTALLHRYLSPEALHKAIRAIRDRTALMTRDVRKNMHERSSAAMKLLEQSIGLQLRPQRARFAAEMAADAALRTRFFALLDRTPTPGLLKHLKDAVLRDNVACAESIWFEFACRADRHLYAEEFEAIRRIYAQADPAEMQIRLIAIADAAARVDRKLADRLNYCGGGHDERTDSCAANILE